MIGYVSIFILSSISLKVSGVKVINVESVSWENVIETTQVYDFRLTESTDPANRDILEDHYDTISGFETDKNKEDSKGIWKEYPEAPWALNYELDSPLSNNSQLA